MWPCGALAIAALSVLIMFAISQPTGVWFWAGSLYAGLYASFVLLTWCLFARQPSRKWLLERLGRDS